MFSKKIIDSDSFLDMPLSAQALYFHLGMRADDDGFVGNPNRTQRLLGCANDDFNILLVKGYVIPFDSGVCVITHWKANNNIRSDRYTPTIYQEEKTVLKLTNSKVYTLGIPSDNQATTEPHTQIRLGKVRLDKEVVVDARACEDEKAEAENPQV